MVKPVLDTCAVVIFCLIAAHAAIARSQGAPAHADFPSETPAAREHEALARKLARSDLQAPLFLCRPDSLLTVRRSAEQSSKVWVEPTRAFDNLFYVGNEFVGVWVLQSSAGLILFDASSSPEEAETKLVPGLIKLGLEPANIKYVIVTHGHWDHYGGARFLQQTFGAHVALGAADWDLIEKLPPASPEANGRPIPKRDLALTDGQKITLGDTTVTIRITPGHTPATVSAIVPVREGEHTYALSLFGSVAFPPTYAPTERTGGLRKYDESVQRFAALSREAETVGLLNTHVFADGGLARLKAARARKPGAANPFLLGAEVVGRYYGVLHECLQAALARPEVLVDWSKLAAAPAPAEAKPAANTRR
jgi:metallo-beta-lactamase class B